MQHSTLFLLFFVFNSFYCAAQTITDEELLAHIEKIDQKTTQNVKAVSKYLVQPAKNDHQKFRSIYLWLIHQIDYDTKAVKKRINRTNEDILRRQKAICWGYATLLQALCKEVAIETEVISGYVKTGLDKAPFLNYPTHAWNAVQLDGQWYLVDATWDSNLLGKKSLFKEKFQEDYYLTTPAHFISNHLPAAPQWQLLDCPITIENFQLPIDSIVQLAQRKDCPPTNTPPRCYATLTEQERSLQKAILTYQFNPTDDNRRDFAHSQIEYQEYLSEVAEQLQSKQNIDSLLVVQKQMIRLCETAQELTDLYDSQLENCAYNYFNHAVALSQLPLTTENEQDLLTTMLANFQQAAQQLKGIKQNIFTENALSMCEEYIAYIEDRL